jgi:DNA-binding XRE family transcriptional regulator
MSAQSSNGNSPLTIAGVLEAYFALDVGAQDRVREQVRRWSDAGASQEERRGAEKRLAAMLRSAGGRNAAGRVLSREERLGPAQRELRSRMEQAEEAFAGTLARLMAERQLTQAQLAERIGVGQSAISMLLKRRCRPQRRTLGRLAEALGVPVDELWPGFSSGWRSGVM